MPLNPTNWTFNSAKQSFSSLAKKKKRVMNILHRDIFPNRPETTCVWTHSVQMPVGRRAHTGVFTTCIKCLPFEAPVVSTQLLMAHLVVWLTAKIVLLKVCSPCTKCSIHQIQPSLFSTECGFLQVIKEKVSERFEYEWVKTWERYEGV